MSLSPQSVLFCCDYNAVRSPMAEGIMKKYYGTRIFVQSAGVKSDLDIDGFSVAVCAEIDVHLRRHHRPADDSDHDPALMKQSSSQCSVPASALVEAELEARFALAFDLLEALYGGRTVVRLQRLINLKGGILAWSRDVDPSVPTY